MNLNGVLHRLAADEDEVFAQWHRLATESDGTSRKLAAPDSVTSPGAALTVDALVARDLVAHAGGPGN